ncbi:cytochrome c [Candidatus Saccharibacteria bacterium]|nr:cytochrome c [Candidatus Saccharibacteria bacterium]
MNSLGIASIVMTVGMALTLAACGARELSADPEVLATGKALYMQHCATCHGANLEGQPNWKVPDANGVYPAPPHNREGHTWHHPDSVLLAIIAQGGTMPNSGMPAFGDKLNPDEMEAILVYIKSFWGQEELEFQREVTQSMQEQSN